MGINFLCYSILLQSNNHKTPFRLLRLLTIGSENSSAPWVRSSLTTAIVLVSRDNHLAHNWATNYSRQHCYNYFVASIFHFALTLAWPFVCLFPSFLFSLFSCLRTILSFLRLFSSINLQISSYFAQMLSFYKSIK